MALEKKLTPGQELAQLEVGNVTRVIGKIQTSNMRRSTVQSKIGDELSAYESLLEEKLPQIIRNIFLIGDQICGLKGDYKPGIVQIRGRNYSPHLRFGQKSLILAISDYRDVNHKIKFGFDENARFRQLSIREYQRESLMGKVYWPKIGSWDGKEKPSKLDNWIPTFMKPVKKLERLWSAPNSERAIQGFCDYYVSLTTEELEREGRSEFADYVRILNMVPEFVAQVYQGIEERARENLESAKSNRKGLTDLEVSEF